MKKNGLCVCLSVAGSKVKKTFSMIFLLSRSTSKKHGLGQVQRSKKHFLWFSYFHVLCRINIVLVGFKGQKNIFFDFSTFAFYVEKS